MNGTARQDGKIQHLRQGRQGRLVGYRFRAPGVSVDVRFTELVLQAENPDLKQRALRCMQQIREAWREGGARWAAMAGWLRREGRLAAART